MRLIRAVAFTLAVATLVLTPATAQTIQITGAGATFPYPIYSKWFSEYNKLHPEVQINYQSIGSGGGIRQLTEEAVFGVEKEIGFSREETCSRCNGNGAEPGTSPVKCATCNGVGEVRQIRQTFLGQMMQTAPCPTCNGRGETISSPCKTCRGGGLERKKVSKKVQIPAGVDAGTQIRLAGEGGPGENGGPQGSLYLVLDVQPHKFFKRRDNDIILNLDINIAQAALGADVTVPTIDGEEKLKIPSGTQSGRVFHLRGKGVPHVRSKNQRGDELVIVNVAVPTKLTKEQRELFEKLAESLRATVQPQEKGFLDWLNETFGG